MPVPSQGHYVFTVFRFLTEFVCLYTYEFWISLWKIVRSSVILLLPLITSNWQTLWRQNISNKLRHILKPQLHASVLICADCIERCKSNYHTIVVRLHTRWRPYTRWPRPQGEFRYIIITIPHTIDKTGWFDS